MALRELLKFIMLYSCGNEEIGQKFTAAGFKEEVSASPGFREATLSKDGF